MACLLFGAACARTPAPDDDASDHASDDAYAVPVDVLADSGRTQQWEISPTAELRISRVAPAGGEVPGVDVARPRAALPEAPVPEAAVRTPPEEPARDAPAPVAEPGLKPPILKRAATLVLPSVSAHGVVELDVRVDETGRVSDAEWAGGDAEPALIDAAITAARAMTFFPALKGGEPVAVWCRQRFDVRAGRVAPVR